MTDADYFVHWLNQGRSSLSYRDVKSMGLEDVKSLPACDLVSVLYNGRDEQALAALVELRAKFEDEMQFLNASTRGQERS